MEQLILLLIGLASLGGITFILYRKIPSLLELPPAERNAVGAVGQRIKNIARLQPIRGGKLLGATLSKMRGIASRTEVKTADWLEKLRKQSEERKEEFQASYWEKLRGKSKKQ